MATLAARDFRFPVLRLGFEPNTTPLYWGRSSIGVPKNILPTPTY